MERVQAVVVAGVLIRNDRTLIIKRSLEELVLPGVWELPSGKVEFGESPEDALIREYKEETGLAILPIQPFSVFHYTAECMGRRRHTVQINYLVSLPVEEQPSSLTLSPEHSEFCWIGQDTVTEPKIDSTLEAIIAAGHRMSRLLT